MSPSLCALRDSMEGSTPALIATCALDGTPNLSYLSAVHYIDPAHVALSFQFFSQTRRNVLENPIARILLIDPFTARRHRLLAQYLRTETEGAVFEKIGAKLAGIASHSGMDNVFRLQGADIYRVLAIEPVDCPGLPPPLPPNLLPPLRTLIETVAQAVDLEQLFDSSLVALGRHLDIGQAMILLGDEAQARLFTVAARGYSGSQIGSEVPLGQGVIGVAARTGVPI
jgi:adenylate cyclase